MVAASIYPPGSLGIARNGSEPRSRTLAASGLAISPPLPSLLAGLPVRAELGYGRAVSACGKVRRFLGEVNTRAGSAVRYMRPFLLSRATGQPLGRETPPNRWFIRPIAGQQRGKTKLQDDRDARLRHSAGLTPGSAPCRGLQELDVSPPIAAGRTDVSSLLVRDAFSNSGTRDHLVEVVGVYRQQLRTRVMRW